MSRRSRLSPALLHEVKTPYVEGASRVAIARRLAEQGIEMSPATVCYHLGLKKPRKPGPKRYLDYVRDDCKRHGVAYRNPRSRENRLWS